MKVTTNSNIEPLGINIIKCEERFVKCFKNMYIGF